MDKNQCVEKLPCRSLLSSMGAPKQDDGASSDLDLKYSAHLPVACIANMPGTLRLRECLPAETLKGAECRIA